MELFWWNSSESITCILRTVKPLRIHYLYIENGINMMEHEHKANTHDNDVKQKKKVKKKTKKTLSGNILFQQYPSNLCSYSVNIFFLYIYSVM